MKATGPGLVLRAERVKRNLSQMDLAIAAQLSHATVHRAERTGRLTPDVAKKLAKALGLKTNALVSENANGRAEHGATAA